MASEGAERRLAAILSADVVGYSRLMAEDEDSTVRRITAYREEIELLVYQHRGRLVDFHGDECLAEFGSAVAAVECATEIQRAVAARNIPLPPDRKMEFRIGVHLGEVRLEGDRIYGDGVNIAARLEALAEPGGIWISGEIHGQVEGKLPLRFEDLGERSVKNIPKPIRVYRVETEAEPTPTESPPRASRRAVVATTVVVVLGVVAVMGWRMLAERPDESPAADISAPIRSIAVLPLENLSGDPEQEYFADGMTEALIGDLAKIGSLRVISRTSVMEYKGARKSLPEIARELNVDAVIEGTVLREGDRVRITTQLIDARNDQHLWADRFDRDLGSILALHSDVARAVAEQIRLELTPEERTALTAARPVDPLAYEAYLRGLQLRGPLHLIRAWGPQSIEQFERAVKIDPQFAEAYVVLAFDRYSLGTVGAATRYWELLPRAREAAERALQLDDTMGRAYAVLANVRWWYDWDFAGAGRAFERAVQLSPSDPEVLDVYAWYLLMTGRSEEALKVVERVLRLAPLDRQLRAHAMRKFFYAGEYERALEELERVRELDPHWVDYDIGLMYSMLGRHEEAHRAFTALVKQCGAPCDWQREALERGWAEGGWEGSRRFWLDAATEREGYSPVPIAMSYALLGETDETLAWLERGYRERDPLMTLLSAYPVFDPLRSDPRFQDLIRRIGFPED